MLSGHGFNFFFFFSLTCNSKGDLIDFFSGSWSIKCSELGNSYACGDHYSKVPEGVQVSRSSMVLPACCLPNFWLCCRDCWMGDWYKTRKR